MDISKLGQGARVCAVSCLLLAGLLFSGCQTNKADSGFSEVPGMPEGTASVATPTSSKAAAIIPPATSNSEFATNRESSEIIKLGDVLLITFGDLPDIAKLPAFDQRVKDNGTITLIYNQIFQAAGKRTGDLEREIRAFYVPDYFRNLTVTVRISYETRFYYVEGEVRLQGKLPYTGSLTVTKAIAAAGGFTDFANKRKVKLIRPDGRKQTINCNKVLDHPELDPQVLPDDKIHVPRRLFW